MLLNRGAYGKLCFFRPDLFRSQRSLLFAELVQQLQAFLTRYCRRVVRGDAFHLGSVCGLLVARVAEHHSVPIQGVQVAFQPLVSWHSGILVGWSLWSPLSR